MDLVDMNQLFCVVERLPQKKLPQSRRAIFRLLTNGFQRTGRPARFLLRASLNFLFEWRPRLVSQRQSGCQKN